MTRAGMLCSIGLWLCLQAHLQAQETRAECVKGGEGLKRQLQYASCLLHAGQFRQSIEFLKPLAAEHPEQPAYWLLLAKAYGLDNNPFWAIQTLKKLDQENPTACESRAWLAFLYLGEGYLDMAREALSRPGCPQSPEDLGRFLMLETLLARLQKDHLKSAAFLNRFATLERAFAEDLELWRQLQKKEDPSWMNPLGLRVDLSLGYTSNAAAGSPTDPASSGSQSGLMRLELAGRLDWPTEALVRPHLDSTIKGQGLTAEEASELSTLEITARPGVLIGRGFPRFMAGYNLELLLLNREDDRLFSHGHRGELELEWEHWMAFAGAGYRIYGFEDRSRLELDAGGGASFQLFHRLQLLSAATFRYFRAQAKAYDLLGGSALVVLRTDLWHGTLLRLGGSFGTDYYLRSGGDQGVHFFGNENKRFEIFAALSVGVWTPAWNNMRLGATYEFSWRDSTADNQVMDFDYLEHRFSCSIRLDFDLNPWEPRAVSPSDHVALDYQQSSGQSALDQERVQDLLRRDEMDRSGACGCGQ